MTSYITRVMQATPAIRGLLAFEPRIGLDLSHTDLPTTLVIISCLMDDGVDTVPAIYSYLAERNSKFDRETIEFLLSAYDGDDTQHHLWTLQDFGSYRVLRDVEPPIFAGGPAWSGDTGYAQG